MMIWYDAWKIALSYVRIGTERSPSIQVHWTAVSIKFWIMSFILETYVYIPMSFFRFQYSTLCTIMYNPILILKIQSYCGDQTDVFPTFDVTRYGMDCPEDFAEGMEKCALKLVNSLQNHDNLCRFVLLDSHQNDTDTHKYTGSPLGTIRSHQIVIP